MTSKSFPKVIYVLLFVISIWTFANFFSEQEPSYPLPNDSKVKIAFIEIWGNYSNTVKLFEEIIEPEVNQYAQEHNANMTFDFIVVQPQDGGPDVNEKIQELHHVGIRYVIGSNCVACTAYSYIQDNDMLLVSSRSTQSLFSIEDEHMFRVCPPGPRTGQVIKKMIESKGITHVAVLRRGDSWADEVYDRFMELWETDNILADIRYPHDSIDFGEELGEISDAISGSISNGVPIGEVGVIALGFAEIEPIVNEALSFPLLMEVTWFGSESTAMLDQSKYVDSIAGFDRLGMYSPIYTVAGNDKWENLAETYTELTGEQPDRDVGYDYDAAWLIALTIMESGSHDRKILAEALPRVASGYIGATGMIGLDKYGDRDNAPYDIMGYVLEDNETICVKVGHYDGVTREITWKIP
jgi:branched-chain amino acid transport system substrate-binding protein